MGNLARAALQFVVKRLKPRAKLLTLGLDSCGKTMLLYRMQQLCLDQQQPQRDAQDEQDLQPQSMQELHTFATIGFNVESFQFKHVGFEAWEVGGSQPLLWRYYYQHTKFVVFVIDSTNRERLKSAIAALNRVFRDSSAAAFLKDAPLLVFANKQDREGCLTLDEIAEALIDGACCGDSEDGVVRVALRRAWALIPLVAMTAQGVNDGLAWLAAQHKV